MLWRSFAASKQNNEGGGLSLNSSGNTKIIMIRRLVLCCSWVFLEDSDPKHTSEAVKKWLNQARIEVLE